jgi:hypothetical protein
MGGGIVSRKNKEEQFFFVDSFEGGNVGTLRLARTSVGHYKKREYVFGNVQLLEQLYYQVGDSSSAREGFEDCRLLK